MSLYGVTRLHWVYILGWPKYWACYYNAVVTCVIVVSLNCDVCSTVVIALLHEISCYMTVWYNGDPSVWSLLDRMAIFQRNTMTSSMESFSALLAFVWGIHRSPVNSLYKDQWRGTLMFINGWVNNREACDLRRHRAHYCVIVMSEIRCYNRHMHCKLIFH